MSHNALHCALVAIALLSSAGCAIKNDKTTSDEEDLALLAQDGSDTSSTENDMETLSTSFLSGGGMGPALASFEQLEGGGVGLHPANIGDGTKGVYMPSGCLHVTEDAPARSATYEFADCTGPFGLAHISGTVSVTYRVPAPNKLVLDFVGTQLKINRALADWSAHAEITAGRAGAREMVWTGQFSGTTARGRAFARTNKKTVAWTIGQSCVMVNGTSDGDVTGRKIHTDVISYSRCKGECPAEGSEIKITDVTKAKVVDIKYNGGRSATFTAPNGKQTQVLLACGL